MKTSHKVTASILGIVVVGIFVAFFILNKPSDVAILYIEKGEVSIDSGNGWKAALDEMSLKKNFRIKTSADSTASIVFFESDILRLEENTEVSLEGLSDSQISIKQDSGETWNKVLRLTGKETYEVETPNSVATVRGTGFAIKVGDEESVIVGDGTVKVKSKFDGTVRDIVANRKARIIQGRLEESNLDSRDIEVIERNKNLDIENLKKIRQRIISNNRLVFGTIKKTQGWTDEDVRDYLEEIDRGDHDVDDLARKSPVELKALDRLVKITKEIQRQTAINGSTTDNNERTTDQIERDIRKTDTLQALQR